MSPWHWNTWIIIRVPAPWWLRYASIIIWCNQYLKRDHYRNKELQTLVLRLINNIVFLHIIIIFVFFC